MGTKFRTASKSNFLDPGDHLPPAARGAWWNVEL